MEQGSFRFLKTPEDPQIRNIAIPVELIAVVSNIFNFVATSEMNAGLRDTELNRMPDFIDDTQADLQRALVGERGSVVMLNSDRLNELKDRLEGAFRRGSLESDEMDVYIEGCSVLEDLYGNRFKKIDEPETFVAKIRRAVDLKYANINS